VGTTMATAQQITLAPARWAELTTPTLTRACDECGAPGATAEPGSLAAYCDDCHKRHERRMEQARAKNPGRFS